MTGWLPDWVEEALREELRRERYWHGHMPPQSPPEPKRELIIAGLAPVSRRNEIRMTDAEIVALPREAFEKLRRGVLQADVNATVRTEYEIISRATVIRISYAPPTITTLKG